MSGPVAVSELRAAWSAVQAGQFRPGVHHGAPAPPLATHWSWNPPGAVVMVLGAHHGAGTTTAALAISTAAGTPVHLIECSPTVGSGLVAAATAELGGFGPWSRGTRGQVVLDRLAQPHLEMPQPPPFPQGTTLSVLDPARDAAQLLRGQDWVAHQVQSAGTVVLAATATVPGLRRLEVAIDMLAPRTVVAVVLGPPPRRWSRPLRAATGPLTRAMTTAGRLIPVPPHKVLAVGGISTARLPTDVVSAADEALGQIVPAPAPRKGRS